MAGEATLVTILRLRVEVHWCKRSQKSSRVILQKFDVQPKPLDRLWVGGSKKKSAATADQHTVWSQVKASRVSGVPAAAADQHTV